MHSILADIMHTVPHSVPSSYQPVAFPDGLKTTGQHPPLYDLIKPFHQFPRRIEGPTVWKAEDYRNSPEKWMHTFTTDEINELGAAADAFLDAKIPLTGISKVSRPISRAWVDYVVHKDIWFPAATLLIDE